MSLPEAPLLGVLPGTGGLTRLVDKRMVRRDLADFFGTLVEGVKGRRAVEWGLVDAFRRCYDDDRLFTYWDYRRGDFHQHRGMRIDLALVTQPLVDRLTWAAVDRNARKGTQPSDHAPLFIDVA